MIASGLLTRFILLEYKGLRKYENEEAYNFKLPDSILNFFCELTKFCSTCTKSGAIITVEAEEDAIRRLTEIGNDTTDYINAQSKENEGLKQLHNRVRLKVLRISALMAVCDCMQDRSGTYDFSQPVVTLKQVEWAYDLVMISTNDLLKKFQSGEIGNLDNDERVMRNEIIRTIEGYCAKDYNGLKSYGIIKTAHTNQFCSYRYICQRNTSLACFRTHRLGATNAIKQTLKNMIETEDIHQAGHQELTSLKIKGQYYKIVRNDFTEFSI